MSSIVLNKDEEKKNLNWIIPAVHKKLRDHFQTLAWGGDPKSGPNPDQIFF